MKLKAAMVLIVVLVIGTLGGMPPMWDTESGGDTSALEMTGGTAFDGEELNPESIPSGDPEHPQ